MHVILVMLVLCGSLLGITYICRYFIFRKWMCLERKDDAWAFTGQWLGIRQGLRPPFPHIILFHVYP